VADDSIWTLMGQRDQGDVKDPNNNRGMPYRSNGKELGNTMQYLVGGVNIAE
jgi:hypothetical protein